MKMNKKYFWPGIILVSIFISLILVSAHEAVNIWYIIGRAIGLIFFPALFTFIISGILRLFKKKLSDSEFNKIFLLIWIIGLLTQLIPHFYGL